MASTAKPPDPMPWALAAILLPESRPPACHMRKTLFPGQVSHTCDCVRSWTVPARGVRSCGVRRRREPRQRHGCGGSVRRRGWAASVGGVLLAAGRACGNGVRVGMSGAGRRGSFRRYRFECAWTLGLVRGPVALSELLLRPPSRTLGCYCVERGWVPKMFLTMRTIRMVRS
jgi:hypothetical protein